MIYIFNYYNVKLNVFLLLLYDISHILLQEVKLNLGHQNVAQLIYFEI